MQPSLHLRALVTLCNDVANGSALRAEYTARIEEAAHISTQHRQLLIDEKKERQKQQAAAEAAKGADQAAGAPDQAEAASGQDPAAEPQPSQVTHYVVFLTFEHC